MSISLRVDNLQQILLDMAEMFASQYREYGKKFITSVIKYKSQQMALDMVVKNFEDNVVKYEPDENINKFVDGMKVDLVVSGLLKHGLKMIKIISS